MAATAAAAAGCAGGVALMAFLQPGAAEAGAGERAYLMLFLANQIIWVVP